MTRENILEFPKSKIVRDVTPDPIEVEKARSKSLHKFANDVWEDLTGGLIIEIENFGIDTSSPTFEKDMNLVIDALKATIYRSAGLDHHLHKFIDESVILIPKGTIGNIPDSEIFEEDDKPA